VTCHDGVARAVPVFWLRRGAQLVPRVAKRSVVLTVLGAADASDHKCRVAAEAALNAADAARESPELVRCAATAAPRCEQRAVLTRGAQACEQHGPESQEQLAFMKGSGAVASTANLSTTLVRSSIARARPRLQPAFAARRARRRGCGAALSGGVGRAPDAPNGLHF
jgi:hypothetical protein